MNKELINRFLHSNQGTRWMFCDLVVGMISFYLGFKLNPYHNTFMPSWHYLIVMGFIYGLFLALSVRLCGASIIQHRFVLGRYEIAVLSLFSVFMAYVFFALFINYVFVQVLGRYIVSIIMLCSYLGLIAPRLLIRYLMKKHPVFLVLYGTGQPAQELCRHLEGNHNFKILGVINHNPEGAATRPVFHGYPVLDHQATLNGGALKAMGADIVVICVTQELENDTAETIFHLPLEGIEVMTKSAFVEHYLKEITVSFASVHWFASYHSIPAIAPIFFAKRLMDVLGGLIGLVLSAPLWPVIAVAVKLNSRGPVFYRQKRIGYRGREFSIIKFRTMIMDAEKNGAQWVLGKDDPRITKVGVILRRTRLDELPQLINIIKGDMSIVGPRPERPEFVKELTHEIPFYEYRLMVPPGLTGWAQICYRYGSSKEDAKRKLQYDLYYIRHVSIVFDIQIILKTLPLMMKGSR